MVGAGGAGPLRPAELAERTGTAEPYAREWCRTQAAAGYLHYHGGRFELPSEVAAALVRGPMGALVHAATTMLSATAARLDAFEDAFRTGRGFSWDERAAGHWHGVDLFTRAAIAPDFFAEAIEQMSDGVAKRCAPAVPCSTSAAGTARPP